MIQSSNCDRVIVSEIVSKNGTSSKRKNFFVKYKAYFIIGFISLAFSLTLAYFDEGYNRFPVVLVDYFFVVLYALLFSLIPLSLYVVIRSTKRDEEK